MTTPATLYDHIPVSEGSDSNKWHGTAPEEGEDDLLGLETIFSDTFSDFVMVPSEAVSEIQGNCSDDPGRNKERKSLMSTLLLKPLVLSKNWLWSLTTATKENKKSSRMSVPPTRSSSIFSTYDWVSEVVIDEEGSRLILPGQLVVLDSDPLSPSFTEDNEEINQHQDFTAPSSMFYSSTRTIMVSAHDLLATRATQESSDPDFDLLTSDAMASSSLSLSPVTTGTSSIPTALWRLASKKAGSVINSARGTLNHSVSSLSNKTKAVP